MKGNMFGYFFVKLVTELALKLYWACKIQDWQTTAWSIVFLWLSGFFSGADFGNTPTSHSQINFAKLHWINISLAGCNCVYVPNTRIQIQDNYLSSWFLATTIHHDISNNIFSSTDFISKERYGIVSNYIELHKI